MKHTTLLQRIDDMQSNPLTKKDWIMFIIIAIFCSLLFQHADLSTTMDGSMTLLHGHILDFYEITHSAYLPSTFIVFGIWNIPLRVMELFSVVINTTAFPVLMWGKLLTSLFYLGSAVFVYKISINIGTGAHKAKLLAFIFLTTPVGFFSQFIFGQYDIITVFFVLCGLNYYFEDKMRKFSIIFGVAITFKYFALLMLIPLLLLKEKQISRILGHIFIAAIPFSIETLIFMQTAGFKEDVGGFNALGYVTSAKLYLYNESIALTILPFLFILVCAFAYYMKVPDKSILPAWALYYCNLTLGIIFSLSMWHPQWLLFAVPFWVISAGINENYKTFYLLDILAMAFFTIFIANVWQNGVDATLLDRGIFRVFTRKILDNGVLMKDLFPYHDTAILYTLLGAIFVVFAIFKHPKYTQDNFGKCIDDVWTLIRTRFIVGVAIFIVPVIITLIMNISISEHIIYKRHFENNTYIGELIQGQKYVEVIKPKDDLNIKKMRLFIGTYERMNTAHLKLRFVNVDSGEVLYEMTSDMSKYTDNSYNDIVFNSAIDLKRGVKYRIIFTTPDGKKGNTVSLRMSQPEKQSKNAYAIINGEKEKGNIMFMLMDK